MAVKSTYTVNGTNDTCTGTMEQPLTVATAWPYHADQYAPMALMNKAGSGKIVTIVDLFIKDMSTPNSTTANSKFTFQKVSAWTVGGGEEKTPANYHVHKFDRNNAYLPAQVQFFEDAQSVTLIGAPIRHIPNLPYYNPTRALAEMCSLLHAGKDSGLNMASMLYAKASNTQVQPITIREGEGFCMTPVNGYIYLTIRYYLNFFIRDISNGACYGCNLALSPDGGRTSFLFVNGSGSGKTYEIYNIELSEIGSDEGINVFSMEKIEAIIPNTGTQFLPMPHDSANSSLSGLVDVYCDCNVTIKGYSDGAIMSRDILIRDPQTNQGSAPYGSGTMSLPFGARNTNFLGIRNSNSDIKLREGEGVAVFKRTSSGIGKVAVTLRFTIEDTSSGEVVAGATNYAYLS